MIALLHFHKFNISVMKKAIIITSVILLTLNILFGMILSSYYWFNVAISSGVIVFTVIMSLLGASKKIKDGFKVSLFLLYSVIGFIQYLIAVFMPPIFVDNWYLIAIIVLMGVEIFLLLTSSITSKRIQ